jgi:hypothetical protein
MWPEQASHLHPASHHSNLNHRSNHSRHLQDVMVRRYLLILKLIPAP